jgi:hypothetical protein
MLRPGARVLADLDQAIEFGTQALAAAPPDHPDRARHLSNLGVPYRLRFERGGVPGFPLQYRPGCIPAGRRPLIFRTRIRIPSPAAILSIGDASLAWPVPLEAQASKTGVSQPGSFRHSDQSPANGLSRLGPLRLAGPTPAAMS